MVAWLYPLSFAGDRWTGSDKEAHFFGAAWVWAVTWAFGWSPWVWVSIAILGVEAVEVLRWLALSGFQRMRLEDGKQPWPVLTDKASPKDVIVGYLGAFASWFLLVGIQ